MIYGISKSKDILLSSIAEALDEDTKKAYTIDRLSDNLAKDLSSTIDKIVRMLDERGQTGIFVNDRGYDNNLIFNHYFEKKQYFVIRLKENRKVYGNHRWKK